MNGTDQQSGHIRHQGVSVYQVAEAEARDVVARVRAREFDARTDAYDKQNFIHQQYMISGGGPSAYVHFVIRIDGQVDHAYLEYVEGSGRAIVGFSHTEAAQLYQAMKDYR